MGESTGRQARRTIGSVKDQTGGNPTGDTAGHDNPASNPTGTGTANDPGTRETRRTETAGITVVRPGQAEKGLLGLDVVKPDGKQPPKPKTPPNPLKGQTSSKGAGKKRDLEVANGMTSAILSTGFSIVASRAGPHWTLTESESKQLAEPIVALFDRYGILEKLAMQSDWAALMAAIGVTITPKALVSYQMAQIKKAQAKGGQQHAQPVRNLHPIQGGKQPANGPASPPDASGGAVQAATPADGGSALKSLLVETQFGE